MELGRILGLSAIFFSDNYTFVRSEPRSCRAPPTESLPRFGGGGEAGPRRAAQGTRKYSYRRRILRLTLMVCGGGSIFDLTNGPLPRRLSVRSGILRTRPNPNVRSDPTTDEGMAGKCEQQCEGVCACWVLSSLAGFQFGSGIDIAWHWLSMVGTGRHWLALDGICWRWLALGGIGWWRSS